MSATTLLRADHGRRRPRRRRIARVVVAAIVALAVAAGATLIWARANLHTSAIARAVWWQQSDFDDQYRFPEAAVAPAATPLPLPSGELPTGTLDRVTVGDRERDLDQLIDGSDTMAFLVVASDELVHESYANGGGADVRMTSFSTAKSFVSALVGAAIARGEIAEDAPLTTYLPDLADRDPRLAEVTVAHLLSMSSGLRYVERGMPWSDDAITYYAPDLRAVASRVEVQDPPGRRWLYNNYNPLLLGMVLEAATGERVPHLLERDIWQPMGAEAPGSWSLDERGFAKMESGVNGLARDFARFGLLFLHQGRGVDGPALPADWVRRSTARDTTTDPAEHYQYLWWVDTERPGRYYAAGRFGQFVYVAPDVDTVVVRMGRTPGGVMWPDVLRDVADRVGGATQPAGR